MKRTFLTMLVTSVLLCAFLAMLSKQSVWILAAEDESDAKLPRANSEAATLKAPDDVKPAKQPVAETPSVGSEPTAEELRQRDLAIKVSELLGQLFPDTPLEVIPVNEAVLLRGGGAEKAIERQIIDIAEQFYPKVLSHLVVLRTKPSARDSSAKLPPKPILLGNDPQGLRAKLAKLYPNATLELNFVAQAALVRGRVAKAEEIQQITDILENYFPKVLNYLTADNQSTGDATNPVVPKGDGSDSQRLPSNTVTPFDSQDAALDREAKQLASRVRAAKEPEKSKLRAELEVLTEKHFELRQQRRRQEIDELSDRVDKLRVAQHRRQEKKPDILKRRIADLLGENDWNEETASNTLSRRPLADGIYWFRLPSSQSAADARMEPIVARLLAEGQVVESINVDDQNMAAMTATYHIASVPTFVVVKDGQVAKRLEGATTYEVLKRWLPEPRMMFTSPFPAGGGSTATDPAAINSMLWSKLGLKVAKLEPDEIQKLTPRYQGGLRVTEVSPNSSAKAEGIQPGDTLVGLHVRETT